MSHFLLLQSWCQFLALLCQRARPKFDLVTQEAGEQARPPSSVWRQVSVHLPQFTKVVISLCSSFLLLASLCCTVIPIIAVFFNFFFEINKNTRSYKWGPCTFRSAFATMRIYFPLDISPLNSYITDILPIHIFPRTYNKNISFFETLGLEKSSPK